jgi:hypothetical protein
MEAEGCSKRWYPSTGLHGVTSQKTETFIHAIHANLIQEEIKRRLNSGNACYYSVQNLLSSRLYIKIRIYKNIILPVVLYGCETWSVTLREGHRLRMFENRVLRRIFGPKRDEVMGDWRKLHKELHNLYSSPNIIRMMKSRRIWAGHVALMGEEDCI